MPKKILIILTGGTICSFVNENGEQESDTKKAEALIVQKFRSGDSKYRDEGAVVFDKERPLDILSENMTVEHWNTLLQSIKSFELSKYDGIIILHGTDTLAYTASLLSVLLAGIKIPVFLISSQLPLYEAASNGNENFKTAVELIVDGIKPNIYVAYRNEELIDGRAVSTMYIHYASHLLQCPNHSDNFYSNDMYALKPNEFFIGFGSSSNRMLLYKCGELTNCVLKIMPYVGIDYSRFSLDGVKVVLHHTYHSGTVSVDPYAKALAVQRAQDSVMYLKKLCDSTENGPEIYLEPCNKDSAYLYETTGTLLRSGVGTSWHTTSEMAYAKLLIGCALGYQGERLQAFMDEEINGEFIR